MKKTFSFSKEFITGIIRITEGIIDSGQFERIINRLETDAGKHHFDRTAESNLIRILSSIYDRVFFFNDLIKYPHHSEVVTSIAANSNYLTDIVSINPEYLYQVFDQEYLSLDVKDSILKKEISGSLDRLKSQQAKINYLRQFKKRILLKIGLADILRLMDITNVTSQLSTLARTLTLSLFEVCYQEIVNKYNLQYSINSSYCLCSLGKLGGNELNYSSDVDLLLFYDANEFYESINKEYQEILSEAALLFIKSSSEISEKGYIYRIDFRLRPDGKYSQICKSLTDYTKYYELRGEDWERQMLIKLDIVGGSVSLFNNFRSFVTPLIYPAHFSSSVKERIRKMKNNIETQNRGKENVKLFRGGIRDIEFSVQALQLIHGGKLPRLRTGNTLEGISMLTEEKLLSKKEKKNLTDAYNFYRRTEHFLQLMNDTQTHLLPEDENLLKKLSLFNGFKSIKDFKEVMNQHRKKVRSVYDSILETGPAKETISRGINFRENDRANKNLDFLSRGTGIFGQKEFDLRTSQTFDNIKPVLIKYLKKSTFPDRVLDNFVKLVRSFSIPSIWYSELSDRLFFNSILTLCEYSDRSVNLITIDKLCAELLLTRKIFVDLSETELNELTINQLMLYLSARFTLGFIKAESVSRLLAQYLSSRIRNHFDKSGLKSRLVIIGLGGIATGTISFSSDIDLIIVSDKEYNTDKETTALLKTFQEQMRPFSIDFRLRPEGKSSQLIWSIQKFEEYVGTRARIWEFQAFLKMNYIAGRVDLFDRIYGEIIKTVVKFNRELVTREIKQMERMISGELIKISTGSFNIKKERGGLSTIDFITDSIVLVNSRLYPTVFGKEKEDLFKIIKRSGIKEDIRKIAFNYRFLKFVELSLQNLFDVNNSVIPESPDKKRLLEFWISKKQRVGLQDQLKRITNENSELFKKYTE